MKTGCQAWQQFELTFMAAPVLEVSYKAYLLLFIAAILNGMQIGTITSLHIC